MNIFTKVLHALREKDKQLHQINNLRKAIDLVKRLRASFQNHEGPEEHPRGVARSPSSGIRPPDGQRQSFRRDVARSPVQPAAARGVARAPAKVEVLHPVPPVQDPVPAQGQVIDVQPVTLEPITRDKDFF